MKNNITEVVFILDASGSMADLTSDTIGGFNQMISEQKEKDGKVLVSVVTFNQESSVAFDRVPIQEIPKMTEKEYRPGGCTALIDALGGSIKHIKNIHKYAREEDVPENTLFIITTDGMENSSHIYTSDMVKKMIKAQKEEGWEFIFMGANIDAVETAKVYGIDEDRAVTYKCDRTGTEKNFRAMGRVMEAMACCKVIDESWKDEIEEDVKKRG